jgi:prepilin-type N-terminal cleavage/methylation domain-containing protein
MIKNFKKKKNNKGFTLVELLVVIAIIGILAVVAVPSLFKQVDKSKAAKVEANYSAIKSGIQSYYADNGTLDFDGSNPLDKLADSQISTELNIEDLELDGAVYTLGVSSDNAATLIITGLSKNVDVVLTQNNAERLATADAGNGDDDADADGTVIFDLMK